MPQALIVVKYDNTTRLPLLPRTADGELTVFDGTDNAGWNLAHNVVGVWPTVLVRVRCSVATITALNSDPNCVYVIGAVNGDVQDAAITATQANNFVTWLINAGHSDGAWATYLRAARSRLEMLRRILEVVHRRELAQVVAMRMGSD